MSRQVRVGILVFVGLALFLVALFAIGSRSFLFSSTFSLQAQFGNLGGLRVGAPVQYQGASAGRVENIVWPDQPGQPFTIEMALQNKVRPNITKNTVAQIKSQSLVGGNMMVVLVNPSEATAARPDALDPVEPGGTIQGQEPFSIAETSDQLLATVDTFANVAQEAQQIMQDVQRGRGSLGRFIYDDALYNRSVATIEQAESSAAEAQQLMTDLSGSVERITASAEEATAGLQEVLNKVNRGEGTMGKLLNNEAAYNRLLSVTDTLVASTRRIEDVLANAENATQWASLGAYRFSENMEALKHNFLFKPYFEERGYMEKADFEIRESAIEATYDDLEQWQRELNEREARLDELKTRLQKLREQTEAPATSSSPGASASPEASASPGEASSEASPGSEENASRPPAPSDARPDARTEP
jgi:phospholipid/cholesterol/gamma-HCH transport system substrate-binding protein